MMATVPAPALDGIGMLRDEEWLYDYLSAVDPQQILPSRLRKEFKMPSYANLTEEDRRTLSAYLASLKVENWYLEEVKKAEHKKLTGESLKASNE
jgi:flagellar motor switch protein FliG